VHLFYIRSHSSRMVPQNRFDPDVWWDTLSHGRCAPGSQAGSWTNLRSATSFKN
jgi:hypothetical protein